ncbi:MAG: hypothetical protein MJ176_01795 [Treponema sp.]|nr:hypothetical protein [Treponema sp.]
MKKAFSLIYIYFVNLILGILCGTFLVGVYLSSLSFIAGSQIHFFRPANLLPAFKVVSLGICFFLPLSLFTYKIRHQGKVVQCIVYIFLQCLTWLVVFPVIDHQVIGRLEKHYQSQIKYAVSEEDKELLSSGYFRESNGEVYYFLDDVTTDISAKNPVRGVEITTGDWGDMNMISFSSPDSIEVIEAASPYKDVLIKSVYGNNLVSNIRYMGNVIKAGQKALAGGFISYLVFLSLALALSVVYMLAHTSQWRAVNYVSCITATLVIIAVNVWYYSPMFGKIAASSFMGNRLFTAMSSWCQDPFIFVANCTMTLLIVILGTIEKISLRKNGGNR